MKPTQTFARVAAAALALSGAVSAQWNPYGSGANPPGSLSVVSGTTAPGDTLVLGVRNTAVSDAPIALALLAIATTPAPGFPTGVLYPGFGMSAPGATGELLVSTLAPDPLAILGPKFWFGGTSGAAPFYLPIPADPALMGATVYTQGILLSPSQGYSIGVSNGMSVTIGPPSPAPGLVPIQPGTFEMGSAAPGGPPYYGDARTQPVHPVTISQLFWMGRYEVTQADFQALMGTNPSTYKGANRPVERVTWWNAMAYCAALNAQETAAGNVPAGYQYRLPTEAEWEFACRAGTTTEYHYGPDLLCEHARFLNIEHADIDCGVAFHTWEPNSGHVQVGSYAPNAWGLFDMHGNVFEWCLDHYDGVGGYTETPKTDPYVTAGPSRIIRGGAWGSYDNSCRAPGRNGISPDAVYNSIGFRVVLAPILVP